jgi:hypothetical protein
LCDKVSPLVVFVGFATIAGLTYFFSSRRRLFIRVFVPRDEWKDALRGFSQREDFRSEMRQMASLQFCFAIAVSIVAWLVQR